MYEIRTDLALEAREKYEQDNVEIKGVRLEKEKMCASQTVLRSLQKLRH